MDSDLQHPPEPIPRRVALWREGNAVVEAYKRSRGQHAVNGARRPAFGTAGEGRA